MNDRDRHDTGRSAGHGPAGVSASERRELLDTREDRRGEPQRGTDAAAPRVDESGQAKDDPSRAPESGTP